MTRDCYEILEVERSATPAEIKHAFRRQIARYHPDKIQHLGTEFHALAADRAAEITEAYRILSDPARRADYDGARTAPAAPAPPPACDVFAVDDPPPVAPPTAAATGPSFAEERAQRDAVVRTAALAWLRRAVNSADDTYDETALEGFDVCWTAHGRRRTRMFASAARPDLIVRFVPRVDRRALAEAWGQAGRCPGRGGEEICVFVIGPAVAARAELAAEIATQRRSGGRGRKVTVVPVDAHSWQAHMPMDAPAIARAVADRLKARP